MSDDSAKRQPRNNKVLIALIIVALVITAAIVIGTYIAVKVSDSPEETVSVNEQTTVQGVSAVHEESGEKLSGFPYTQNDGTIKSLSMFNKKLLVLSDGSISLLDSNASQIFSVSHSFSDPAVKIAGDHAILYDKASNRYIIFKKDARLFNSTTENGNIITGDISVSGQYALATSPVGSSSLLSVYSPDGSQTLFEWKCSPERIVSVAISPKGNNIAAAALGAQNGQIVSKIYLLNLDMTESPEPYICEKGAVTEVKYISEKLVSVVTDSERIIINQDGEEQGYAINIDAALLREISSDNSGNTAVLLDSLDGMRSDEIYMYNKQNSEKYDSFKHDNVSKLFCADGRVYLLCDSTISCYNSKGSLIDEIDIPVECSLLCASGSTVYCTNGITVYSFKCG